MKFQLINMNKEDKFTYKLLLLYIFNELGDKVLLHEVTDIFLKLEFLNIFMTNSLLDEMFNDNLIESTEKGTEFYTLSKDGLDTIVSFKDKINSVHKLTLDNEIKKINLLKSEQKYSSSFYFKTSDNNTNIELYFKKPQGSFIKINLNTETNSKAELICENWDKFNAEMYTQILNMLTLDVKED